jgi:stress response protein SCP2
LKSDCGAVIHSGDVKDGSLENYDEEINIDFNNIG